MPDERRVVIDARRAQLADLSHHVVEEQAHLVLAAKGHAAAALVPYEGFRLTLDLEDQIDHGQAEKALAEAKAHGTTPWEQVKPELGL